ncbi:hypothetical protein L227DRAFT_611795 [Lentinus tigrinus ALCF2SS1-6]|uniref:Uncharacterized protein n=1 Tax=Lentinus tigrinus ALCF2SS1-6 TaxID=1328759 RepID=A0A5C2S761_9APHY|nr:hypothetical protein L227DRAFT_611795 [Lentinus tigrinus ALCF2SS1-6]
MPAVIPRHFNQYSPAEHIIICSRMDMRTLLNLRCASRLTMYAIAAMQRLLLERLCGWYLPAAPSFLNTLGRVRGFIGGDVAASFIMRQVPPHSAQLEIYVGEDGWAELMQELSDKQGCAQGAMLQAEDSEHGDWMVRAALESVVPFFSPRGCQLWLFEAATSDPLAPIACRPSTPHLAYINPFYFGAGYPFLTMARRGLVADLPVGVPPEDIQEKWEEWGVDVRLSAGEWLEYRHLVCASSIGLCPSQVRGWADGNAMHCRMLPLGCEELDTTVLWRLARRKCGVGCRGAEGDPNVYRLPVNDKYVELPVPV